LAVPRPAGGRGCHGDLPARRGRLRLAGRAAPGRARPGRTAWAGLRRGSANLAAAVPLGEVGPAGGSLGGAGGAGRLGLAVDPCRQSLPPSPSDLLDTSNIHRQTGEIVEKRNGGLLKDRQAEEHDVVTGPYNRGADAALTGAAQ